MDWDTTFFLTINGLAERSAGADWIMLALGWTTSLAVPGALAFSYWLWLNRREALIGGVTLTVLVVLGDLLGAQLKHLVGRVRPCHVLTGIHQLTGCGGTFSFPSNHALNVATVAAFFQVLYPATGWVTWPVVVLAGFSRVYVGAHYATDVLGGWLIGAALGAGAALWLTRWPAFRPFQSGLTGSGRSLR
ncbi:MAG: phosphatase PAP2 family protein [Nitrospirota bacterium]